MQLNFLLLSVALVFITACTNTSSSVSATRTTAATVSQTDFSGRYVNGGHDDSYMMIIEKTTDQYIARYAYIEGMLPPQGKEEQINLQPLKNFAINTDALTFSSDSANGKFQQQEGQWTITFDNKKDIFGEPLVLTKE